MVHPRNILGLILLKTMVMKELPLVAIATSQLPLCTQTLDASSFKRQRLLSDAGIVYSPRRDLLQSQGSSGRMRWEG